MILIGKKEILEEKPASAPLCPPKIPYGRACARVMLCFTLRKINVGLQFFLCLAYGFYETDEIIRSVNSDAF